MPLPALGRDEQFSERPSVVMSSSSFAGSRASYRFAASSSVIASTRYLTACPCSVNRPPPSIRPLARAVEHGVEWCLREVVDPAEVRRRHVHVEGEQDVALEAADTFSH